MTTDEALQATREAVLTPETFVARLHREYGDTPGIRRLSSDVTRLTTDLDEIGQPAPGHRPRPTVEDLLGISDEPHDESMWCDAEHEGFGALDRRAP